MKEFFKRGFVSAWGGPVVLAIIFLCIGNGDITLADAAKGILSITALAFIAGGITTVYQIEKLALFPAILIHGLVLYGTYLAVYLLNGWLAKGFPILIFSICFVAGYALIWLIIFCTTRKKAAMLTQALHG